MDFLRDLAIGIVEMIGDWPLGTVIGLFFLVCVLLLFRLAVLGSFLAVDSWFLPRNRGVGRVVGKTFTPAHTEIIPIYNAETKTRLIHPIFHSDDWSVRVALNGQQDNISVSKELFDSLSKNNFVLTEYVSGRLSRSLYIKALPHV